MAKALNTSGEECKYILLLGDDDVELIMSALSAFNNRVDGDTGEKLYKLWKELFEVIKK